MLQSTVTENRSKMPKYHFHMKGPTLVADEDGTELPDEQAARRHAKRVAWEVSTNADGFLGSEWSEWSMSVEDETGVELFTFSMDPFGRR